MVKGYGLTESKDDLKDLKTCLMKCGNEQSTTFLFETKGWSHMIASHWIVNEQMVEAINSVLNSGDVPNLYKNEDTNIDILVGG